MSMPIVMIATTNAGRPTIGRIAVRSMSMPRAAVQSAATVTETKNERLANATMPIAGAT